MVYIVDIVGPSRLAIPGKMSFLSVLETGPLLSWGCVVSLGRISLCPIVGLHCISSCPLIVSPTVQQGSGSCEGVHGDWGVVQPSRGIGGVVLSLHILILVSGQWVSPLEEGSVERGPEVVKSSRCVPLYCIYQLSGLSDINRPFL